MKLVEPISTIHLFPALDEKLLDLLKSLSLQDWGTPTIVPHWRIKDIAAHLLDGNIRTLSMLRDGYFGEKPDTVDSYHDLVAFLNRLNADWVNAMARVSPRVLIELIEITGKEYMNYLKTLDLYGQATFAVAWAGEQESVNWFHIAREYTEKWHHQQQIRLAVGQERELYSNEFYGPYLSTSMRALPYHYRTVQATEGDVIKFSISGVGNGDWFLHRTNETWILLTDGNDKPICEVTIKGEIAWRIFTKGIARQDAEKHVTILGDQYIGNKIFDMLAVMA
jgi:hypothetical protein